MTKINYRSLSRTKLEKLAPTDPDAAWEINRRNEEIKKSREIETCYALYGMNQ